ncbi:S4 domain-containing protein YaaA [Alicyclobacillus sp. SO9]|uniref:S4 domain-containing protein YaaA n=1 Tax=Alicyclobacillus sp. SO9 TaxID=2665646 RepID=UPI00351C9C26
MIEGDYITLAQFLKLTDVISSGGQAKFFLQEENVYVNGIVDKRRGRKLYPGDEIQYGEQVYVIRAE